MKRLKLWKGNNKRNKMAEEQNIEERPTDNNEQSIENKNISDENIQQSTLNTQHTVENMEVHKHLHHVTHKKKWGEYLLEFFMLFLAVFLGFIAENMRENYVDSKKEKSYIRSMIDDLKADTTSLSNVINKNYKQIFGKDSMVLLLDKEKWNDDEVKLLYNYSWDYTGFTNDIFFSKRTIAQLFNAGGLRLIENQKASDAISVYETSTDLLEKILIPGYKDFATRTLEASAVLFDNKYVRFIPDISLSRAFVDHPVLMIHSKEELKRFNFLLENDKDKLIVLTKNLSRQKELAINLLTKLREEYNL